MLILRNCKGWHFSVLVVAIGLLYLLIEHDSEDQPRVDQEEASIGSAIADVDSSGPGKSCGSCFGAADSSCCNSCEAVQEAYRKKKWKFDSHGVEQCKTVIPSPVSEIVNESETGSAEKGPASYTVVRESEQLVYSGLVGAWTVLDHHTDDAKMVLEFAADQLRKRGSPDVEWQIENVVQLRTMPMNYSLDGTNALRYKMQQRDPENPRQIVVVEVPLTLGRNYLLELEVAAIWSMHHTEAQGTVDINQGYTSTTRVEKHTMVVYQDFDAILGLTRHTWERQPGTDSSGTMDIDDPVLECEEGICSSPVARPAKFLSFNAWNYNTDWQKRLGYLVDQVQGENVDVIGWQEVRYDNGKYWRKHPLDSPEGIAESMKGVSGRLQIEDIGYANLLPRQQFVFKRANTELYLHHRRPNSFHVNEGVAVSTSHTVVATDHLIMSRNASDPHDMHQRVCLRTLVNVPRCGPINFFTTHLSLMEVARARNILELWEFVQKHHTEGVPSVLVGDMNCEPDSRVIKFLLGKETINGVKGDFIDSWTSVKGEEPLGYTFRSWNLTKRIDFILVKGDVVVKDTYIIGNRTEQVESRTESEQKAIEDDVSSDHLGLVAMLAYGKCMHKKQPYSAV